MSGLEGKIGQSAASSTISAAPTIASSSPAASLPSSTPAFETLDEPVSTTIVSSHQRTIWQSHEP